MNVSKRINELQDYYYEKYGASAPYFDSDECHLVVKDGISIIALIALSCGSAEIEWKDSSYANGSILQCAVDFFSVHDTSWGVYSTQY